MECSDIKALLSEYVDETLDTQTRAQVDQHLSSCTDCQKDLASLRALVRELGSLQAVEPPEDFLNQLHERLEKRSRFSRFIQSLFVPTRIKIPLQVASAAIMAILVFSILHVQQAEYKLAEAPVSLKEEGFAGKGALDAAKMAGEKYGYEPKPAFEEAALKAPAKESAPIELVLLLKKEVSQRAPAPSTAMEAAPGGARESKRTLARKQPLPIEKLKEDESADKLVAHEPLFRVKNLVELVQGKVLSIEYEKETEQPRSILAEIPAAKFSLFQDQLNTLGNLQAPPEPVTDKDQESIQVRIRLLSSS